MSYFKLRYLSTLPLLASLLTVPVAQAATESHQVFVKNAGFYVITTRLADNAKEGMWSVDVLGNFSGGINSGAMLYEDGTYPGFMTFELTADEAISVIPAEFTGLVDTVNLRVQRINNGVRENIQQWENVAPNTTLQTEVLPAGFYVLEVFSAANAPRGRFGVSMLADNLNYYTGVGGWLDSYTGGVPEGFAALYIPERNESLPVIQETELNLDLHYGDSFGDVGADKPALVVYQQLEDSSLSPIYFSTSAVQAQQWINSVSDEVAPAINNEGSLVAYVAPPAEGQAFGDLFLYQAQTQTSIQLSDLHSTASSSELVSREHYVNGAFFTPDDNYLIYATTEDIRQANISSLCTTITVYEISNAQSTVLDTLCGNTQVTLEQFLVFNIDFNPSTQRVLVLANTILNGTVLREYDLQTKEFAESISLPMIALTSKPSFSADGRFIAFISDELSEDSTSSEVYRYDLQTSELLAVSENSRGLNVKTSINDDGSLVGFINVESDQGKKRLFIHNMNLDPSDTERVKRIDNVAAGGIQHGFILTEQMDDHRRSQVYLENLLGAFSIGSNAMQLTLGSDNDSYLPAISENGRYVVFYSHASQMRGQSFTPPSNNQLPALYVMSLPY